METSDSGLDPVVLSGWPSCTECISFSKDGEVAVATGEIVHILTPKQGSKSGTQKEPGIVGLRNWHSARICINIFTQREWPDQYPAPSRSFSLGEEQSLSIVVGLAWSPPGLGPHRRSVLAVLTSNHVLSIWESNGTIGEWTRVVLVNHSLGDYFGWVDEAADNVHREKTRIRAFAWSPPYEVSRSPGGRIVPSKWGAYYLAVATDEEAITLLRVSRWRTVGRTEWDVKATCHTNLPIVSTLRDGPYQGSLFQKAMTSKSPVSRLSWWDPEDKSSQNFIRVARRDNQTFVEVQGSLLEANDGYVNFLEHNLTLNAVYWEDPRQQNGYRGPKNKHISEYNQSGKENGHHDAQTKNAADDDELKKIIMDARKEFDSNHSLDGNSIVREWGFASSDAHYAACITLHPSDMVEYTTASLEKCTVLFAPRAEPRESSEPFRIPVGNPADVLFQVANWVFSASSEVSLTLPIDRNILGVFATYAAQIDNEVVRYLAGVAFNRLRETSKSQLDLDEMEVDEPVPADFLSSSDMETCLICEALIPFEENDIARARCETGHPYSMLHQQVLLLNLLTKDSTMQLVSACNTRTGDF